MPLALLTLTLSVAAAAPHARPANSATTYEVGVVAGIGSRRIEGLSTVQTQRDGGGIWTVRTLRTTGTWDDVTGSVSFDSDAPEPGAPWPLITQHAVAAVPVRVQFDRDGRPISLEDAERWQSAASDALEELDLPDAGVRSGEALVDPDGLLLNLRRTFVGTPTADWTRTDRLTGVTVERRETCERSRQGGITTWSCRGEASALDDSEGQIQDAQTWTTVRVDRRGLLDVEDGWSGTLVHMVRDGETVTDSPIGGRRLVLRR